MQNLKHFVKETLQVVSFKYFNKLMKDVTKSNEKIP